jgi:hypothetical protein
MFGVKPSGNLFNPSPNPVMDRCKVLGTLTSPHRARFGVGIACRRRREPALAPQAFLCVPAGHVLADPKQLKAAWAAGSLTRRALRRPPLSRPRHLGDPRQALSAVLRFVRLEGSIPLPRQPPPRVPRGNSCLTTPIHGCINLFKPMSFVNRALIT